MSFPPFRFELATLIVNSTALRRNPVARAHKNSTATARGCDTKMRMVLVSGTAVGPLWPWLLLPFNCLLSHAGSNKDDSRLEMSHRNASFVTFNLFLSAICDEGAKPFSERNPAFGGCDGTCGSRICRGFEGDAVSHPLRGYPCLTAKLLDIVSD
jgi:hypothetical protein